MAVSGDIPIDSTIGRGEGGVTYVTEPAVSNELGAVSKTLVRALTIENAYTSATCILMLTRSWLIAHCLTA